MAFLLDTNIISETVRAKPEARVIRWLQQQSPAALYLASQTMGELVRGACKLRDTARRQRLISWIEADLSYQFDGRVLPFDTPAAQLCGQLMGEGDRRGRTPSAADAQIAAVAITRRLVIVTRNVKDFEPFDVPLLNPWN